jgi:hypothetical protein
MTPASVRAYLNELAETVVIHQGATDRCHACGMVGLTVSVGITARDDLYDLPTARRHGLTPISESLSHCVRCARQWLEWLTEQATTSELPAKRSVVYFRSPLAALPRQEHVRGSRRGADLAMTDRQATRRYAVQDCSHVQHGPSRTSTLAHKPRSRSVL